MQQHRPMKARMSLFHLNHCTAILSTGSAYFVTFIELQISAIELEISQNMTYLKISPNE